MEVIGKTLKNNKKEVLTDTNFGENQEKLKYIVVIGTSTGGPKALKKVISSIPPNVKAAFLVVQHMPSGFTKSLANRLDYVSMVKVKEAEENEIIKCGHVYIAPGDFHLLVKKNSDNSLRIKLTKDPPVNGHRPSVDVLMRSVSETKLQNIIGVVMTGMGRDGSEGVKILKELNKAYIIAQDEKVLSYLVCLGGNIKRCGRCCGIT